MIFLLSCTGNTRWAARQIAKATGDRIVSITQFMNEDDNANDGMHFGDDNDEMHFDTANGEIRFDLDPDERVGFCFPVHGWRPPLLFRRFVERLSIDTRGHYVYAVCTAGDDIGETIDILRRDLVSRSIHLDTAFSLIMPESYLGLPFFGLDDAEGEQRKKRTAAVMLSKYIETIMQRDTAEELVLGRWPRVNSRVLGAFFTRFLISDKHFHVEASRCVGCGICANTCPTRNITLDTTDKSEAKPQWRHDRHCLACFACYHHCPHHAIEYGSLTKNKGQYFFEKNFSRKTKKP